MFHNGTLSLFALEIDLLINISNRLRIISKLYQNESELGCLDGRFIVTL